MDSFANMQTAKLTLLRESNDIEYLKNELVKTEKSLPDCAAESLYRTNKLCILKNRIAEISK